MRTILTLALVAAMTNPVGAACGTQQCRQQVSRVRVVNNAVAVVPSFTTVAIPSGFIATQFAVPVGIPVSPLASYYYQQMPEQQPAYNPNPPLSAKARTAQPDPPAATSAQGVLANHCTKCHSGEAPKGGLDLSGDFASLPAEARRTVLLRTLSTDPAKRMPKGGQPLSADEFKLLLQSSVQ